MAEPIVYTAPVRYFEVDQQGVVFNMWYLGYLDEAFGAFVTRNGITWEQVFDTGVDVQLVHTELDWSGSLRWGDEVSVRVELDSFGRTSFTMRFIVSNGAAGAPVLTATTVYVCVATDGSGSREPTPLLREALSVTG